MFKHIQKSLTVKMSLIVSITIIMVVLSLSFLSYTQSSKSVKEGEINNLETLAELKVTSIENKQLMVQANIETLGSHISNNTFEEDTIETMLQDSKSAYDGVIEGIFLADANGDIFMDSNNGAFIGINVSDREYFKASMNGESTWSTPILSKDDGSIVIVYSRPVNSDILVSIVDFSLITNIIEKVQIGENGYAYLIDQDGIFLSHPNQELVGTNIKDLNVEALNQALPQMTALKSDIIEYEYKGIYKTNLYVPLAGQWSLSINAVNDEYLSVIKDLRNQLVLTSFIILLIGLFVSVLYSRKIVKSIKRLQEKMLAAESGDLTIHCIDGKTFREDGDEINQMASSLDHLIDSFGDIVYNIRDTSNDLASSAQELAASSEESGASAAEVATNVSEISKGSEEQNSLATQTFDLMNQSNNDLNASMTLVTEMSEQAKRINKDSIDGKRILEKTVDSVSSLKEKSKVTSKVIQNLVSRTQEIGKLNDVITNISEQTNLLALNASIEAARAGDAGKGFAVVANEIRHLATQTQDSVNVIHKLLNDIQGNVNEVNVTIDEQNHLIDEGVENSSNTQHSFNLIIENVEQIIEQLSSVQIAVNQSGTSSEKASVAIEEMVSIIQQSVAGATQVAAAAEQQHTVSEEIAQSATHLAGMSTELIEKISVFHVKEEVQEQVKVI